jgi:hypothetical protein
MKGRMMMLAMLAAIGAAVATELPELRRYLKIERM